MPENRKDQRMHKSARRRASTATMSGVNPRMRKTGWMYGGVVLLGVLSSLAGTTRADTLEEFNLFRDLVRRNSKVGGTDRNTEANMINHAWADYINQQAAASVPAVGAPAIGAAFPVSRDPIGDAEALTFQLIDPSTRQRSPLTSNVFSVVYEVNLDPDTPDVQIPIGMSSDAASDFSLVWTSTDFEPVVTAIPLDANSDPISIVGVGGCNVAVGSVTDIPIPEPAPLALLALGGLMTLRRRVSATV